MNRETSLVIFNLNFFSIFFENSSILLYLSNTQTEKASLDSFIEENMKARSQTTDTESIGSRSSAMSSVFKKKTFSQTKDALATKNRVKDSNANGITDEKKTPEATDQHTDSGRELGVLTPNLPKGADYQILGHLDRERAKNGLYATNDIVYSEDSWYISLVIQSIINFNSVFLNF